MKIKDILTIDELAERIGISPRTTERWEDKGMPIIRIGDLKRVYLPNFMKWFLGFEKKKGEDAESEQQRPLLSMMRKS